MGYIHISHLSFHYEGHADTIFEDVTLNLDSRWRLGLVGRNGRGKTTLLKLILGELDANGTIQKDVTMRYFPYPVTDMQKDTSEIIEEMLGELDWRIYKELNLLEVDAKVLFQPFATLSPGERTKVLLACLFINDDDFVLIDEPTNHLDEEVRRLVSRYLKSKQGFILVSHDRNFLDECIDHVLSINKKSIALVQGNMSMYMENRKRLEHDEQMRNIHLKKDIKRLKKAIARTSNWSYQVEKSKIGAYDKGFVGHKAAKMMQRSKNIERRYENYIEEKQSLLQDLEEIEDLKLHPLPVASRKVISLDHVSFSYDNKKILEDFSLVVEKGTKLCLKGRNGSGKSTILKLMSGELQVQAGKITSQHDLKIAYAFQDTSNLSGTFQSYLDSQEVDGVLCRAILHKLGFHKQLFEKRLEDLSQGQKKKVVLASTLSKSCHLYLFDEPMNYIDLDSRMQIEALLQKTEMTCVFVEHDSAFCHEIATQVCELRGGF